MSMCVVFQASLCTARKRDKSVLALLAEDLNFPDERLARMLQRHPALPHWSAEDAADALNFLRRHAGICKVDDLAAIVQDCPKLLMADIDGVLTPTLATLHAMLPKEIVELLIRKCPEVLLRTSQNILDLQSVFHDMGIPFEKIAKKGPRTLLRDARSIQQLFDFLLDNESAPQDPLG